MAEVLFSAHPVLFNSTCACTNVCTHPCVSECVHIVSGNVCVFNITVHLFAYMYVVIPCLNN